jgi:hypothetical protein
MNETRVKGFSKPDCYSVSYVTSGVIMATVLVTVFHLRFT